MRKGRITIFDTRAGLAAEGWKIEATRRVLWGREPILLPEGFDWIKGAYDAGAFYIDPATRKPVALRKFAVSVEGNRIEGIPDGSKVLVKGRVVQPAKGAILIVCTYPESVPVGLYNWLYEPAQLTLDCQPNATARNRRLKAAYELAQDYSKLRRAAYAPAGDTLDSILRALAKAVDDGAIEAPPETLEALARWAATKERFPKP